MTDFVVQGHISESLCYKKVIVHCHHDNPLKKIQSFECTYTFSDNMPQCSSILSHSMG